VKINNLSLAKQVLYFSIIILVWIILYKLAFLKYNELFPGAFEVGEIFYSLATSVMASSIFYYIVVYRPLRQKHQIIKNSISKRVGLFKLDYILIKKDIYELKSLSVPENLPSDYRDFEIVCEGILLTDKPPVIYNNPPYYPPSWFDYFDYYFSLESSNIKMLHNFWDEIPGDVKVLLEELQTNALHGALSTYRATPHSYGLSDLAGPLWDHLNILKRIPETLDKTLRI
jgi:hypothetical protein